MVLYVGFDFFVLVSKLKKITSKSENFAKSRQALFNKTVYFIPQIGFAAQDYTISSNTRPATNFIRKIDKIEMNRPLRIVTIMVRIT